MKSIRKMDERELMLSLKTTRICYIVLSLTIFICNLLDFFWEGNGSIYLSIIIIVDVITYAIASIIYDPNKKDKNEK